MQPGSGVIDAISVSIVVGLLISISVTAIVGSCSVKREHY